MSEHEETHGLDTFEWPGTRARGPSALLIAVEAPRTEETNRNGKVTTPGNDARLRVVGPIGGVGYWTPAQARAQADRLRRAADMVDELQAEQDLDGAA